MNANLGLKVLFAFVLFHITRPLNVIHRHHLVRKQQYGPALEEVLVTLDLLRYWVSFSNTVHP